MEEMNVSSGGTKAHNQRRIRQEKEKARVGGLRNTVDGTTRKVWRALDLVSLSSRPATRLDKRRDWGGGKGRIFKGWTGQGRTERAQVALRVTRQENSMQESSAMDKS